MGTTSSGLHRWSDGAKRDGQATRCGTKGEPSQRNTQTILPRPEVMPWGIRLKMLKVRRNLSKLYARTILFIYIYIYIFIYQLTRMKYSHPSIYVKKVQFFGHQNRIPILQSI